MKIIFRLSMLVLALGFGTVSAFANSSETARVIRIDKGNHDLMIERQNGTLWILQHNPLCSSMTSEFPVSLILSNGSITQLKVNFNEICKVYNAFPYSGEALMDLRILSDNELHPEDQAEMVWSGRRYSVAYGEGCRNLREMVGKKVYLSLPGSKLQGGAIKLPGNGGQCSIRVAKDLGSEKSAPVIQAPRLEALEHQAQNNQVYFYWKAIQGEKPLYLVSYSRYRLNPSLYPWEGMPNLKVVQSNSHTVRQLANKKKYYFYLASLGKDNVPGEWTEVVTSPISPGGLKNNPDPETFEVKMIEGQSEFKLSWPAKEAVRKFRVSLYVNGKFEFSKMVGPTTLGYSVPKKPEYKGKGFRFTVRSLGITPYAPTFFDGEYWEYGKKNVP